MDACDLEARVFLQEFEKQPEDVRTLYIYILCQTMCQAGLMGFVGAFRVGTAGTALVYENRDTGEVFEIVKPPMTVDEERAVNRHIGELLQESTRAV